MTVWYLCKPFSVHKSLVFFLLWSKQGIGQCGRAAVGMGACGLGKQHLSELPAQHITPASASLGKHQLDEIFTDNSFSCVFSTCHPFILCHLPLWSFCEPRVYHEDTYKTWTMAFLAFLRSLFNTVFRF